MSKSNPQFGKVPSAPIFAGALRSIARQPSAAMVFLVYVAHADDKGEAYIGEKRIAELTGLHDGTIWRSRAALKAAGLLIETGRKVGRCKVFRIADTPPGRRVSTPHPGAGCRADTPPGRNRTPHPGAGTTEYGTDKRASLSSKGRSSRPRDEVWDSVVAAFGLIVTDSSRKRIGKVVAELKAKGAAAGDVSTRLERYRAKWPNAAATPEALAKHWETFAESDAGGVFDPLADLPDANDPRIEEVFGRGGKRV